MTASAFSLSSLYASNMFEVTGGETVVGGLHGSTRHYFCPRCMSWLFTKPEGIEDFVNIRSVMLDNHDSYTPFIETYTDEKLSWAKTSAIHSFAQLPAEDQFPELIAEFALNIVPRRRPGSIS